jgi:hypothetical protein
MRTLARAAAVAFAGAALVLTLVIAAALATGVLAQERPSPPYAGVDAAAGRGP